MPRKRLTFSNQMTYLTNADVHRTVKRLGTKDGEDDQWSRRVSFGPESSKSGYVFRLKRFNGSMVQLSPRGKLTVWFSDFEFLEKELAMLRRLLVPQKGQKLALTLSKKDEQRLLQSLQGVFRALYPSELESRLKSEEQKSAKNGSIESELPRVTAPYDVADQILGFVQNAMNDAWNRGSMNALFFLKPIGIPMRDLVAEASWVKEQGHYLETTDIEVLTKSGVSTPSELTEHNRQKIEHGKSLSYVERKTLQSREHKERMEWVKENQPSRVGALLDGGFVPNLYLGV